MPTPFVDPDLGKTLSGVPEQTLKEIESIGPYEPRRVLGYGGMGAVFLAEQTKPVTRKVAIKLFQAEHLLSNDLALARFTFERQALAQMSHPNIASVYEAGSTTRGNPYYIMEWIDGVPITEYCDAQLLDVPERIQLFHQVCEAVEHAHQRGILHRDLKPANILVTTQSGRPVPKIIDFGVAKRIERAQRDTHMKNTDSQEVVGTPMYMSPEQIYGRGDDIDTRSDLYSLGVVLYELLCGHYPYEAALTSRYQLFSKIITERPLPPSLKIRKSERALEIARCRKLSPRGLVSALKPDLDAIVLRLLEKEPSSRYRNVGALMADIIRLERRWPVSPLWDRRGYVLAKYVARNRLFIGAVLLVIGILAFNVVTVKKALETQQQALVKAERASQRATSTVEYLQGVLSAADPYKDGSQVKVMDLLEKASFSISQDLKDQPEVEESIRRTLGWTYIELGAYDKAEHELQLAKALCERLYGPNHLESIIVENTIGRLLYKKGLYREAADLHRYALGQFQLLVGKEHVQTTWAAYNLAKAYDAQGRLDEAIELFRENVALRTRLLGADHPNTLVSINSLALSLAKNGQLNEAESLLKTNLEKLNRVLGDEHPNTLNCMANLAQILAKVGNYPEAVMYASTCLTIQTRILGEKHPETLASMDTLAQIYQSQKLFTNATEYNQMAYTYRREVLGETHPLCLRSRLNLGLSLVGAGREKEALSHFQPSIPLVRQDLPSAPYLIQPLKDYGLYLVQRGAYGEAESILLECESTSTELAQNQKMEIIAALIQLYKAWGKQDKVEYYQGLYRL